MNGKLHKYRRYGGKVYEHYTRGRYGVGTTHYVRRDAWRWAKHG